MITANLTIKYRKFNKKQRLVSKYGYIVEDSANRYTININSEYSLLETVGTLFHEFSHFVLFTIFKDSIIPPDREEKFCEKIDEHAQTETREMLDP